jgi:hypothetical protein
MDTRVSESLQFELKMRAWSFGLAFSAMGASHSAVIGRS